MSLTMVTVTGTIQDASGQFLNGEVSFTPSTGAVDASGNPVITSVTDTAGSLIVAMTGVSERLNRGAFSVQLVPTDTAGLLPAGWMYQVTIQIPGIPDYGFTCFIPSSPNPVDLSALTPTSSVAQFASYLPLSGGTMTGPLTLASDPTASLQAATKHYVDTNSSGGLSNPVTIAQGGTGVGTQQAAINALTGTQSAGKVLRSDGTNATLATIQAGDVPTLNQNTTGTAGGLSAALAIGSGGTGQTSAPAALNALGGAAVAGDIGGTSASPQVTGTHLASALPVNQGGTGSTTRNFAGLLTPTVVKTSAYNAVAGDYVPCDTTSAGFTVTLPAAPADLTVIGVKMVVQGSTNAVTIAAGGSDVFNKASGSTSVALSLLSQGVVLQYKASGAIWYVVADDLPLSQLDSRYSYPQNIYNIRNYGATGNGVTDDTAACNAALLACHNAGGGTVLAPPGTYLISAPLVIYSNTRLQSSPDTVFSEAAASNCNMIQNYAVTPNRSVSDAAITTSTATLTSATAAFTSADVGATVAVTGANQAGQVLTANISSVTNGTTVVLDTSAQNTVTNAACSVYYRDANIEIAGGTWNRNSNGYTGTGTPGQNSTQLRFVDGLYVHDMTLTSGGTAKGYQLSLAAVTNFIVRNITATAPGAVANTDGVSVVGPACRGIIDTITGGVGDDFIALHTNANQGTVSAQVVGNIYDILVTNIFPNGTGQGAVKINSSTGQTANAITVRTVHGTYTGAITFASQQPNITDLLFDDIDVISPAASGANIVYINCPNATGGTLTFRNVALRSYAYSTAINMFQMAAGSNLGTLILDNLTWEAGTTGNQSNVLQLLASVGSPTTVNNILINRVTGQNTAAAWTNLVLAQQYSTIDCLTIRDVTAWTTQAGNYPLFNAQGTVQTVILDGIYLNGGGELVDTATTASAMQIIASNIVSYAAHRLFKMSSSAQTDIMLTGVNVNTLNQAGLINFGNVNPTVTVQGSALLNPSNVALFNGSTPTVPPRVIHLDARVDVATIATNVGDRAYNTNAGSATVGPVIYTGTKWTPLYTVLDATAGDIAALGSQAAGSIGKAADAGHVHPTTGVAVTSNNLSDLGSASTARTNLGLGAAAVIGTPVSIANGGTGQSARTAPTVRQPGNPGSTTSTTLVMMGVGSTCTFTPTGSGTVLVNVTCFGNDATGTAGITCAARYGTGTAPTNGAAVSGTRFGGGSDPGSRPAGTGSGAGVAFAYTDILTLTPSTAYWFDLAILTGNATDAASLINISMTFVELP